jgi:hypothetical protein
MRRLLYYVRLVTTRKSQVIIDCKALPIEPSKQMIDLFEDFEIAQDKHFVNH